MKYIWKKCYKNFFGYIFLGTHTIQLVPKYIWMWHWQSVALVFYLNGTFIGLLIKEIA